MKSSFVRAAENTESHSAAADYSLAWMISFRVTCPFLNCVVPASMGMWIIDAAERQADLPGRHFNVGERLRAAHAVGIDEEEIGSKVTLD